MQIKVIENGIEKNIDAKNLRINNITLEDLAININKYKELYDRKQEEVNKLISKNSVLEENIKDYEKDINELKKKVTQLQEFFIRTLQAFLYRGDKK